MILNVELHVSCTCVANILI